MPESTSYVETIFLSTTTGGGNKRREVKRGRARREKETRGWDTSGNRERPISCAQSITRAQAFFFAEIG
jgi:hypothetical protein